MQPDADTRELTEHILSSRKYRDLYPPTVERIVASVPSGRAREREEAARNKLHQVWGAYWETRPDFAKLFRKLEPALQNPAEQGKAVDALLALHASTRERTAILPDFFSRIWSITGHPASVIDHGCGFMPLAYALMGQGGGTTYTGYDIDRGQNAFLNDVLAALGKSERVVVRDGDVLTDAYPPADVVLMLKLLPLLEQQADPNAAYEAVARQKCDWLVVSYPTASIGGREKGMTVQYRTRFEAFMQKLGGQYTELSFPEELVFVVRR